jgi:hypothetical protein
VTPLLSIGSRTDSGNRQHRLRPGKRQTTAFVATYRLDWVKKAFGQFDACDKGANVVIYATGTLYGVWQDGRTFSANCYLDRYEVRERQDNSPGCQERQHRMAYGTSD